MATQATHGAACPTTAGRTIAQEADGLLDLVYDAFDGLPAPRPAEEDEAFGELAEIAELMDARLDELGIWTDPPGLDGTCQTYTDVARWVDMQLSDYRELVDDPTYEDVYILRFVLQYLMAMDARIRAQRK